MGLLIDGSIVVIYFVGITAIGLYMGRRENSLRDFALGGRRVPWWAVMASIIAAETSAATFLGTPGEGYEKRSLAYVQLVLGVIIGRLLVATILLKPYFTYKVYTVYDYLGVRFGAVSKLYASAMFLIFRTLASGARLFIPSLVMVLAWRYFLAGGNNVQYSSSAVTSVTPYAVTIIVLTIITCIYTAIGGIKAVIWTDVIQAALMFTSALVAIGTLLYHIGGFHALGAAVPQMKTLQGYFLTGLENSPPGIFNTIKHVFGSEYTIFSAIIGATFANMAAFGTDQDMVQRLLTAETYKKSRRSLMTAALMDIPIASAFTLIGILLWVYYQQSPKFLPTDRGTVVNSDVFGSYILNVMPVGIRGIVLAGVFATAMGSFSAALNALATSATNDWYLKYFARGKDDSQIVKVARWFTLLFAVLMVIVAVGFAYLKVTTPGVRIIPVVLGLGNFVLGPMLGMFLLGTLTKTRGSDLGNVIAVTSGLIVTAILGAMHWVAFTWFAMIGAIVVFAVGIFFATPENAVRRAVDEISEGDDRPMALR